ncbi:MAG: hypothetical protein M4D80_37735 [Myxococcota bacterium]|nr:hypothetical protein [Myxococcota bacterium]
MKLPLSVTISAVVHLVAIAFVGARELSDRGDGRAEPTLTAIEIVAPAPPPVAPPPPVDVQFLDESTTTSIVTARPFRGAAIKPLPAKKPTAKVDESRAKSRINSRGTGNSKVETPGTTTTEPGKTQEPGTRSPYFDMRRGTQADLFTLPKSKDDLDHVPAGTIAQKGVATSGQLDDAAGGRKKSHQDVFVAQVDRDGSVKIKDTKNLQAELSLNPAKLLSGRFDVTDYLMRKTKNDPYASRKLKFLDETRDERVEIGKQWRQQQLQQTTQIIRKNLSRAWAQSSDLAARKQALFELWDEIVEPKSRDDLADEVLVEASRAARRAVVGFIKAHLPAGSAHAYSESELIAFNAKKQSSSKFAPYE